MRTEIAPRAKKKSRLDRIAHYNMHMVLKIKEEDRGLYVYETRKAYRKCRNKKAKKEFLDRFVEESGYNRKQAEGMKDAFEYCLTHTPFPIKSINVDNGSEFLNYHAIRYWKSKEGIKLTHSRPSMKNDNAHAEQKNRTHVRELFARYRFDEQIYVDEMNKIYEQTYTFRNFILPCKVLKNRILNHNSNRYRRVYDKACTPVERIINYPGTLKEVVEELQRKLTTLNYFDESLKLQGKHSTKSLVDAMLKA